MALLSTRSVKAGEGSKCRNGKMGNTQGMGVAMKREARQELPVGFGSLKVSVRNRTLWGKLSLNIDHEVPIQLMSRAGNGEILPIGRTPCCDHQTPLHGFSCALVRVGYHVDELDTPALLEN